MATSGGAFRSGKTGRTQVQGQRLKNREWHCTFRGQDLDTTNFESNGYEEGLTGIIGCDWNIKGNWDAAAKPLGDPPGLFPRDDGTNMVLYTKVQDNQGFSFPLFRVDSGAISVNVDQTVSFEASGKSQGTFSVL